MSHQYQAVLWNTQKVHYDRWLTFGIVVALGSFAAVTLALFPETTIETLLIRAFGATAFTLLTVVLAIGPLARLDARALVLLYNRRHLGVATFLVAAVHAIIALIQFHALGDINPLASVLSAYPAGAGDDTLAFQIFGLFALTILLMMAATSHDFWLANLSAPVWKTLHMLVYFAYAAVIVHVAFGAMQDQGLVPLAALLVLSAVLLTSLHLAAGWKDRVRASSGTDGWVAAGDAKTIPDGRARVVLAAGERVAVFRFGSEIMALSAICQHQNGPLGEGCIIDGLVTCPWHGYQYDPRTGASPPPYTEQIPTFDVRLQGTQAWISAVPNPLGSEAQTASLPASEEAADG